MVSALSAMAAEESIRAMVVPLSQQDLNLTIEVVPLAAGLGRILAQSIASPLDFPPWDNSAMDGYAVRYADVTQATPEHPVILTIVDKIPAGNYPQRSLQLGEAARIFTGSILPPGADTIVPQEDVEILQDVQDPEIKTLNIKTPEIKSAINKRAIKVKLSPDRLGAFVRYRGEYYTAGTPLLPAGIRLGATDLGVLAAAHCPQVPVYRSLRVGLLSTGNELVALDTPPPLPLGKGVDSNQVALGAILQSLGIVPMSLGIVPDDPQQLKETIARSLPDWDVLISSGGVSVGDYDYVEQILEDLGANVVVRSVAVKPGKPLTVAKFAANESGPLYFGLPGNPVSALVSFWRFVQPALEQMSGWAQPPTRLVTGYTTEVLQGDLHRETYIWGKAIFSDVTSGALSQGYWFTPAAGSKSSGNIIRLSQVNALAILPAGQRSLEGGSPVTLWRLW